MSASTIYRAANDLDLQQRVTALAHKEVQANDALANTQYGRGLLNGVQNIMPLMWPVAVDYEEPYESAVLSGRGAPGHDTDVITDANISAAIVAGWPSDPAVMA